MSLVGVWPVGTLGVARQREYFDALDGFECVVQQGIRVEDPVTKKQRLDLSHEWKKKMPEQAATYESIARRILDLVARVVKTPGDMIVNIDFIESSSGKVELQVRCVSEH